MILTLCHYHLAFFSSAGNVFILLCLSEISPRYLCPQYPCCAVPETRRVGLPQWDVYPSLTHQIKNYHATHMVAFDVSGIPLCHQFERCGHLDQVRP